LLKRNRKKKKVVNLKKIGAELGVRVKRGRSLERDVRRGSVEALNFEENVGALHEGQDNYH